MLKGFEKYLTEFMSQMNSIKYFYLRRELIKVSSTKSRRHTHKYHSVPLGAIYVWACALPNCNHYMPDIMSSMVPGKMSLCHGCNEQFVLDHDAMKDYQPKCLECRTGINIDENLPLSNAMEEYLKGRV